MNTNEQPRRKNYARRAIGAMLGFSPLLLLLVSLIVGASQRRHAVFAAVGFITAGAVVAVLNFYLSFIRPRIYWSRHGSKDGYRFVSGMPIIGTVLTLLGAVFGFGAVGIAVVGIGAFALDTGGSGWFVVLTWRDRSFWDA